MIKLLQTLAIFWLISANTLAATWSVDTDDSSISFVSIKKNNIAETHRFTDFNGSITDNEAMVVIKADSVDTRVPIRDERMREFLFNTGVYPTIRVRTDVSKALENQGIGDSKVLTLMADLEMHGKSKELPLTLRVSHLSESKMVVSTTEPVLVRAANFDMVDGILKLSSLVNGLPIVETVPVSFSLVFKKAEKSN